jgi:hypothetical protein
MKKHTIGLIVLVILTLACLIALIIVLTNSCKNSGFRLKKSFTTPTVLDKSSPYIPKVVYMTYHDIEGIPPMVLENIKKYCKGYIIEIHGDQSCEDFLYEYFGPNAMQLFREIKKGAHKADFWRYCILYAKGGYYFDIKTDFKKHISDIFNKQDKKSWFTVISQKDDEIYNGIIATPPKNPIFWSALQVFYTTPQPPNYTYYLAKLYSFIQNTCQETLHPGVNSQNNGWSCTLFKEHCVKGNDRYGFDCVIKNGTDTIFNVRYKDFPWPVSNAKDSIKLLRINPNNESFTTPTVLDNLAFFTTGANTNISSLITGMVSKNITANKIFVVGPSKGSYDSFKELDQISSSPIQFIRLITDDSWIQYINGPPKTLAGKSWEDVLSGYHDIIKNQVPIKTWKYAGICCTSEGEGKITCLNTTVKSGDFILGTWNAMYAKELTFQMAGGAGNSQGQYSNFTNSTFGEVCSAKPVPGAKINADHWMPEYTYEPASLNGVGGCCDTSTNCTGGYAPGKGCKMTGLYCQMTNPTGWVELVSKCGSCGSGKTTQNGQTQYITIGMPASNADCRFINNQHVIEAMQTLIKNEYENICIYTR